jgi:selenocysteine lyase/cysteine desulfurase
MWQPEIHNLQYHFDIDAVRAQFPSLALKDAGKSRVYFDNPAGTQVPQQVIDRRSDGE